MKLELKFIAGYLPYDLKGEYRLSQVIGLASGARDETRIKILNTDSATFFLGYCKPHLYPLSSLTRHREDLGFVPSERLAIHLFDFNFMEMVVDRKNTNGIPFWVVQNLYEWHFDLHGLIESGLAVDIETLKP